MLFPIQTNQQLKPILKACRKRAGLTQAGVALLLNVTQQSYAKIEANPGSTSAERLFSILRLLGCHIFLSEDELGAQQANNVIPEKIPARRSEAAEASVDIKSTKRLGVSRPDSTTTVATGKKNKVGTIKKVIAPASVVAQSTKKERW